MWGSWERYFTLRKIVLRSPTHQLSVWGALETLEGLLPHAFDGGRGFLTVLVQTLHWAVLFGRQRLNLQHPESRSWQSLSNTLKVTLFHGLINCKQLQYCNILIFLSCEFYHKVAFINKVHQYIYIKITTPIKIHSTSWETNFHQISCMLNMKHLQLI